VQDMQQCKRKPFKCLIKLLKAELNPICHFVTLLGAHLIFHVSRIRVNIDRGSVFEITV
jgi:hypothetical protein